MRSSRLCRGQAFPDPREGGPGPGSNAGRRGGGSRFSRMAFGERSQRIAGRLASAYGLHLDKPCIRELQSPDASAGKLYGDSIRSSISASELGSFVQPGVATAITDHSEKDPPHPQDLAMVGPSSSQGLGPGPRFVGLHGAPLRCQVDRPLGIQAKEVARRRRRGLPASNRAESVPAESTEPISPESSKDFPAFVPTARNGGSGRLPRPEPDVPSRRGTFGQGANPHWLNDPTVFSGWLETTTAT